MLVASILAVKECGRQLCDSAPLLPHKAQTTSPRNPRKPRSTTRLNNLITSMSHLFIAV